MFHLGSVQGLISSWVFSVTESRLQSPRHFVLIMAPLRFWYFWNEKWHRTINSNTLQHLKVSRHPIQAPGAHVCFLSLKVAEWNVLSASAYFHIMSPVQFYTLASNRFHLKAWNHLKLQPTATPEYFFPDITSSHLNQWNMTSDCSLSLTNPDFDIYFKTIAMGQRKPSLGLGGWSITGHMPSVLLSSHIVFKDAELYV